MVHLHCEDGDGVFGQALTKQHHCWNESLITLAMTHRSRSTFSLSIPEIPLRNLMKCAFLTLMKSSGSESPDWLAKSIKDNVEVEERARWQHICFACVMPWV